MTRVDPEAATLDFRTTTMVVINLLLHNYTTNELCYTFKSTQGIVLKAQLLYFPSPLYTIS